MIPRGLILAFQFLTRLPTPKIQNVEASDLARSSLYFPLIGLVIGAILAGLMWTCLPRGPWLAAIVVVIGWAWITGALHLDGLGDVADALGAAHGKPERLLEVLKDPHAGNFAVVAITLQVMAKLVLLAHLTVPDSLAVLVMIPAWARWGPLVWRGMLPALRPGLGQDFTQSQSLTGTIFWAAALSIACLFLAPKLLGALLIIPAIGLYWRWRLGGITGDCLGASVEISETLLLACLVFW